MDRKAVSCMVLIAVTISGSFSVLFRNHPFISVVAAGLMRNFYLVVKPDFGGIGYDVFSPQTLVAQLGDQVNITVRNTDNTGFQLRIESIATVNIQPGTGDKPDVTPVDTPVPVFTASSAGIFSFFSIEHPEMRGQFVVFPQDWTTYNPPAQTRSLTQLILPDFAGDGYDVFFSGVVVVNQGDNVNITVRNTDDMPHGFAVASYGINVAVNPGQDLPNGTIVPLTTTIPPFTASVAGVYSFICTTYCGPGHDQMVGSFAVLPKANSSYLPQPQVAYRYITVKPDFAGDGYDKWLPDTIFVNQGDLVYVKIRNTDEHAHGFTLPAFNINNETVAGGQNTTQGFVPADTYVTPFFSSQSSEDEFFCTIYCGPGHNEMIGYLVVLPRLNGTSIPPTQAPPGGIPVELVAVVGFGLFIVGVIAGLIIIRRSKVPTKR